MTMLSEDGLPYEIKIFYGTDMPVSERVKFLDAVAKMVYNEPWNKYETFVVGDAKDLELTQYLLE